VRVAVDVVPGEGFVDAIRPVVCPLGGDVVVDNAEVRLWLPRA
jgi:hypothetical protein